MGTGGQISFPCCSNHCFLPRVCSTFLTLPHVRNAQRIRLVVSPRKIQLVLINKSTPALCKKGENPDFVGHSKINSSLYLKFKFSELWHVRARMADTNKPQIGNLVPRNNFSAVEFNLNLCFEEMPILFAYRNWYSCIFLCLKLSRS